MGYDAGMTWPHWLVDDQREASGRPDVVAFVSDVLTAPVKISGQPIANLIASTSGTDSDWVVKLIDVYPDEVAAQPAMGGYQLMVSADIFRGRYRESLERAKAIAAESSAAVPLRAADGQPRLPAGAPDHGAGPIELVPALRSQPADLRAEHLLGEAGGLPQGHAADLSRSGRASFIELPVVHGPLKPIRVRVEAGGVMSSRIASKTAANFWSYLSWSSSIFSASSPCESRTWRTTTKARMILDVRAKRWSATWLLKTLDSIATPSSVKAYCRVPPAATAALCGHKL